MKHLITDADGLILRTVTQTNDTDITLQLHDDGVNIYAVPDDAGLIDDSKLSVVDGVLTRKVGVVGDIQHEGLAVTQIES